MAFVIEGKIDPELIGKLPNASFLDEQRYDEVMCLLFCVLYSTKLACKYDTPEIVKALVKMRPGKLFLKAMLLNFPDLTSDIFRGICEHASSLKYQQDKHSVKTFFIEYTQLTQSVEDYAELRRWLVELDLFPELVLQLTCTLNDVIIFVPSYSQKLWNYTVSNKLASDLDVRDFAKSCVTRLCDRAFNRYDFTDGDISMNWLMTFSTFSMLSRNWELFGDKEYQVLFEVFSRMPGGKQVDYTLALILTLPLLNGEFVQAFLQTLLCDKDGQDPVRLAFEVAFSADPNAIIFSLLGYEANVNTVVMGFLRYFLANPKYRPCLMDKLKWQISSIRSNENCVCLLQHLTDEELKINGQEIIFDYLLKSNTVLHDPQLLLLERIIDLYLVLNEDIRRLGNDVLRSAEVDLNRTTNYCIFILSNTYRAYNNLFKNPSYFAQAYPLKCILEMPLCNVRDYLSSFQKSESMIYVLSAFETYTNSLMPGFVGFFDEHNEIFASTANDSPISQIHQTRMFCFQNERRYNVDEELNLLINNPVLLFYCSSPTIFRNIEGTRIFLKTLCFLLDQQRINLLQKSKVEDLENKKYMLNYEVSLLILESLCVQMLFSVMSGTRQDVGIPESDLVGVRKMICSFVENRFQLFRILPKIVTYQGFPLDIVPTVIDLVPSFCTALDFGDEYFKIHGRKPFAIHFFSYLIKSATKEKEAGLIMATSQVFPKIKDIVDGAFAKGNLADISSTMSLMFKPIEWLSVSFPKDLSTTVFELLNGKYFHCLFHSH